MNKELRSELETQGNLLETMSAEMETFKGESMIMVEGNNLSRWCALIVAFQGYKREGRSFVSGRDSPNLKQ
jgi:hypothetical protein